MWEFSVIRALGLLLRTLPLGVCRAAICLAIAGGLVAAAGIGAALGQAAFGLGEDRTAAGWGALLGLGFGVITFRLLRGRLLWPLTAAQIAAMVELLDRRPMPIGRGQVAQARALVRQRFGDAPSLRALDRLVRGVIRTATGLVDGLLVELVPIPALDRLARATGSHLVLTLDLIDGAILAHALRTRSENAWEAAHDGLVLYTQNARTLLTNAFWLALTGWVLAGLLFLATLSALASSVWVPGVGLLLAAIFAWAVKSAVYDPFALACLVQLELRLADGQDPLPEWRGRLTQVSDKFRQLGDRALRWTAVEAQDA